MLADEQRVAERRRVHLFFCFLNYLSELRILTTFYLTKTDHQWVNFVSLKTITLFLYRTSASRGNFGRHSKVNQLECPKNSLNNSLQAPRRLAPGCVRVDSVSAEWTAVKPLAARSRDRRLRFVRSAPARLTWPGVLCIRKSK